MSPIQGANEWLEPSLIKHQSGGPSLPTTGEWEPHPSPPSWGGTQSVAVTSLPTVFISNHLNQSFLVFEKKKNPAIKFQVKQKIVMENEIMSASNMKRDEIAFMRILL